MNKISVIIPSYNHSKFIEEAVNSVLNQTYENLELIIIDDGSQDNTWDIVSQIRDNRVKLFKQENAGAHETINRGLSICSGDYITILNSDDVYALNRFEKCINEFKVDERLGCVCSYIELINEKSDSLGIKEGWHNCEPWPILNKNNSYAKTDNFAANLIMSNFVATTSNIFFKKTVYEQIGHMRNLRFAHDWDFMLRVANQFKCTIIQEPILKYRLHNSNTINTNRKWLLFEICLVIAINIDKIYGKRIFPIYEHESVLEHFQLLNNSLNFQGNDRVFWILRSYMEAFKENGIKNPEDMILNDITLRKLLIDMIVDEDKNIIKKTTLLSRFKRVTGQNI